jgi:hypothetical protein
MRFYPDEIVPTFSHEPSAHDFEIKEFDGGVGVATLRAFKKGEMLFRFSGVLSDKMTLHSLTTPDNKHLHDPWFMGRVLHRCEPNCHVDMKLLQFTALRDIEAGEWVTMDYLQTEQFLFRDFMCHCGPMACGGKKKALISNASVISEMERAQFLLSQAHWRFAKTLAYMPHYYTRKADWDNQDDFVWVCDFINRTATQDTFKMTGKYVYNYLYAGEWKYWVMERDKAPQDQILINKADPRLVYK